MSDRDPLTQRPAEKSGCAILFGWILLAAVATLLLTLVVSWRMSLLVTDETRRMAETVAETFQKTLNFTPEVRVDSVVIMAASAPVLELVTVKKQALVRHTWTHTWLHSTKTLEVEATFTARAGFDLQDPLRIQIDPNTKWFSAQLPPVKLLALEMGDIRIPRDEDGLWNKLTPEDREQALRGLEKKARHQFARSAILAEARLAGEERIREVLAKSGVQIKIDTPRP